MTDRSSAPAIDWESFYRNYRKPGYLPGFELLEKLGSGMFGLVFKARKQSIGRDYAVKFLKVDDPSVRDAVLAELESLHWFAQVDHPNLVSIEDRGEVSGIPYIVMAFAGRETLQDRLTAAEANPDELLHLFAQACRGVEALHSRSLVHFDLKPANVFLKGAVARVGDYGLSRLVAHSRNSLSMGRGTPFYMAPEMLQRRGDARSDVYSLGVMLYEILLGDVPFRGDSEWEVLRKHETEAPSIPKTLPTTWRELLSRCLAKQPEERFANAGALVTALQVDPTAAPPPAAPPPKRPEPEPEPPPPPKSDRRKSKAEAYEEMRDAARAIRSQALRFGDNARKVAADAMERAMHDAESMRRDQRRFRAGVRRRMRWCQQAGRQWSHRQRHRYADTVRRGKAAGRRAVGLAVAFVLILLVVRALRDDGEQRAARPAATAIDVQATGGR
ncbi:MAG: serine/threonine-protein kinase [Planctomycetota bacterium]